MLISLSAFAQIKTKGFVEIGAMQEREALNHSGFVFTMDRPNVAFGTVNLEFVYKKFHFENEIVNILSYPDDSYSFGVLEVQYKTKAFYKFSKKFRVGFEHLCIHPIINQHNEIEIVTRRTSYNKVFFRFSFGE